MKKALIGIPCLYGEHHTRLAIESVVNENIDLLLVDNGAENSVKSVINYYHSRENVHIISNEFNIYVNAAWNQIAAFFLNNEKYTHLILMNSDLILSDKWHVALERFYNNPENAKRIPVPVITDHPQNENQDDQTFNVLTEGIPGVFIVLPREAVEKVYPVPDEIKIWFGDNFLYDLARGSGFETGVLKGLVCYHFHGGSQSIQRTADVYRIIEQDKIAWANTVQPALMDKINRQ